jgi:hypothetical protein
MEVEVTVLALRLAIGEKRSVGLACAGALALLLLGSGPAWASNGSAQSNGTGPEVTPADRQGTSPPLRDIPPKSANGTPRHEHPLRPTGPVPVGALPDPVVQTSATTPLGAIPGSSFAGVGDGAFGFVPDSVPPDPNLAVGATQVVQWVNESFAVFDKATGVLLSGPKAGNTLWAGFGGPCETNNDGDPIVQYDKAANRWVLTQLAVTGGPPSFQCVAVSQTSDATLSYNLYAFKQPGLIDYPKLGVWPDAYYLTFNIFDPNFVGARVCALDRNRMSLGLSATQQCFQQSSSVASLLPSDLDGSTLPPPGSPNYLVNFGRNKLNLFKFHVDFLAPANSTLTGPIGIPVASFTPACKGRACIQQLGTGQRLDSLADRLMYRFAYRNFVTHESLVVNHSVNPGPGAASAVRWYEIRNPNNPPTAPVVFQQGTFAPDSTSRWMGSIAMDKLGDMLVGYSASSSAINPAVRVAGRVPTDAAGTLETEASVIAGTGSQTPFSRWGDYTSMSVDPVDDCTFFYTNEYLKADGTFNWSTRIASFKFPLCI